MESSILKQIARFLQEQKKQKRWLVVFVCMAIIVGFGTVTALKMRGQAMTHKEKVVICQLDVHEHTDECYDEAKENVICGYADYVVHVHNDDCYDWNGNLTCQLPEVEKHEHSEECYTEEKTLICGQEEAAGHTHTAECYTTQQGGLICQVPEHAHAEGCYDENGEVICGMEEHAHTDACYEWTDVLTCQLPEGADGHTHTDACYEVNTVLSCGKLELHTHTDECYEKINEEEELSETNRRLICTIPVLEEHVHTEEAGCFEIIEVTANGEVVGEEPTENEDEKEIFTTDLDGEDEENEDTEANDTEVEDKNEKKTYDETRTYEGDGYVVTASYNKDANIPEDAEFVAKRITEESDAKKYEEHETEFKKSIQNEDSTMSALFEIGFYAEGEEITPESPVEITIQLVDKNGLPEGVPVKVVHFGEEESEVLDGSKAESGSTSFTTDSFSPYAVGYENEAADAVMTSVHVSESTIYEDDVFRAVFHIEGDIKVAKKETDNGEKNEDVVKEEEAGAPWDDETDETQEKNEEEDADALDKDRTEIDDDPNVDGDKNGPVDGGEPELKFEVKPLSEDSEEYAAAIEYVNQSDEKDNMLKLQFLTCSLTYEGEEADISECKVTTEITVAESLNEQVKTSVPKAVKQILGEEKVAEIGEESIEKSTGIMLKAMKIKGSQVDDMGDVYLNRNSIDDPVEGDIDAPEEGVVLTAASQSNPQCTVQYYAYAQIMEDTQKNGIEAIPIVNTCLEEGILGGARLPSNKGTLNTKNMYVEATGTNKTYEYTDVNNEKKTITWPVYTPVYKDQTTTDSLTKLYTADKYEFSEIQEGGLNSVNKFAKDGLNYDLYEIWVLQDTSKEENKGKVNSFDKSDWTVYSGDLLKQISFTNNANMAGDNRILIKEDTVIRLVGKTNREYKDYPTLFFDYDITNGSASAEDENRVYRKGINSKENYSSNTSPLYGFGNGNNTSGITGLANDKLDGHYINQAVQPGGKTTAIIRDKCAYELVEDSLSGGYPAIRANAPDLFNPTAELQGREVIPGRALTFERNGDTYTLIAVAGSGNHATNLNQFQKGDKAWAAGVKDEDKDQIWTNQFWPMDNASTFGASGHDPKFGTEAQKATTGLIYADDRQEHNSFFGMSFEVDFELTDDYVGPLNYYFFGDDDMWVFLEDSKGNTQLICDIGGVHQAAGEYVDLWNYIQKPTDEDATNKSDTEAGRIKKYKLKFFYTERGASGSTCWMQFTLPSVNAVPVPDYTGNVKSTLTVKKEIDGEVPEELLNEKFDFKITFEKDNNEGVGYNTYPYEIKNADGTIADKGDIYSGGTFKLSHNQTIEVFNLPDDTKYTITEANYAGYEPGLDNMSEGVILKDKTVEGNIDWDREDKFDFVNQTVEYELPKTGGVGPIIYTMAGVLVLLTGAGFMYRKKVRERRV